MQAPLPLIGRRAMEPRYKNEFIWVLLLTLPKACLKVHIRRWEALKASLDFILSSKGVRVQARKLASFVGTSISMKLDWGPITQL